MRLLYRPHALAYHYHVETIDSAIARWYERGLHFDVLADAIDDPALYIRTHLVTPRTLPLFFNRDRLVGQVVREDQGLAWFMLREALRWVAFNRFTIPLITFAIRASETSPIAALIVSRPLLRGTASYHFRRGVRDLRRRRAAAGAVRLAV